MIGAKVNVGENSFIRGSVILDGCAIGRGSQLLNCVVDEECEIGARCAIDRCAIIGCGAFIGPSTVIRSNCTVSNDSEYYLAPLWTQTIHWYPGDPHGKVFAGYKGFC